MSVLSLLIHAKLFFDKRIILKFHRVSVVEVISNISRLKSVLHHKSMSIDVQSVFLIPHPRRRFKPSSFGRYHRGHILMLLRRDTLRCPKLPAGDWGKSHVHFPLVHNQINLHTTSTSMVTLLHLATSVLVFLGSILVLAGTATPWYHTTESLNDAYIGLIYSYSQYGNDYWVTTCEEVEGSYTWCGMTDTSICAMVAMIIACIVAAVVCVAVIASHLVRRRESLLRLVIVIGSAVVTTLTLGKHFACVFPSRNALEWQKQTGATIAYAANWSKANMGDFMWHSSYPTGGPLGWIIAVVSGLVFLFATILAFLSYRRSNSQTSKLSEEQSKELQEDGSDPNTDNLREVTLGTITIDQQNKWSCISV